MEHKRLHPMVAIAAVSVTLVSLAGVAAITGLIPTSQGNGLAEQAALSQTASAKADAQTPVPAAQTRQAITTGTHVVHKAPAQVVARAPACAACGQVVAVTPVQHKAASGSGLGAATGAILGGLLGHQVGGGNGKTLATVAGAVGGGMAGNEVEKRANTTTSWEVKVRMDDGSMRSFSYASAPGFQSGDTVQIVNGQLAMRG